MAKRSTSPLIPGASFYLAAAMLLFGTWYIARSIMSFTGGLLIYGLDDPYIHLSIARSLMEHGVFGVSPEAVSFASSSMLWPLLLAGVGKVAGHLTMLPFVFSVLSALGSLWLIEAIGKREGLSGVGRFLMQFLFIMITPILPMIFNGMEHALHLFTVLAVLYLYLGLRTSPGLSVIDRRMPRGLHLLSLMLTVSVLVRYESVFIGIGLTILFLSRRQWRAACETALAAALPIIVSGLVMIAGGGYFLSNSLLVKGPLLESGIFTNLPNFLYYYLFWPETQAEHWRMAYLAVLATGVLFVLPREGRTGQLRQLVYMLLGIIALHVLTVRLDQFSRYTAYLVGSGLVLIILSLLAALGRMMETPAVRWNRTTTGPLILLAVMALVPLLMNGMTQNRHVSMVSRNIYEQQYQLGRFLSAHYRGELVALNDLGAMTYYGHIRPVDLVGLAEPRIAIARRHRVFNTDSIRAVVKDRGAGIAIVYPNWFPGEWTLPAEWIPVEDWILQDNYICGGDTVRFYGTNRIEAATLRERLDAFRPRLPRRVLVNPIMPSHASLRTDP